MFNSKGYCLENYSVCFSFASENFPHDDQKLLSALGGGGVRKIIEEAKRKLQVLF